jgi:hypothetical protein
MRLLIAWLVILGCSGLHRAHANPLNTKVGVIRWDAWVGDANTDGVGAPYVGQQVERSLGPYQYHNRVPFYGQELSSTAVHARATTQAVMDAEIAYANRAGIDFWAFVYYANGSGMDIARHLYESSTVKGDLKFSHIIGASATPAFAQLISDFVKPTYQKVLGNRPLLFIFTDTSAGYTRADIDTLRNQTMAAGAANPYVVMLNYDGGRASNFANVVGADAISAYVTYASGGGSYSGLSSSERNKWNAHKSTGKKVVPWVTAGWDPRPRITNPVTWTSYAPNAWTHPATPSQIREQVRAATTWAASNVNAAEAGVALMYAWNEFDEGGWVCPTLWEGTARVDAISDALRYAASSTWDESQTPRRAFDGDPATNWQAAYGSAFAGQWLEVDFGVESTFSQVYISEYGNRTGYYRIEYYAGDAWRHAYSGYGIGAGLSVSFPTVRGRKARVVFESGVYTPVIYEFQVNNSPAQPSSNLALYKSYLALTTWAGSSQQARHAFDGDPATNWQAAQGSSFSGQWLQVSFGEVRTFNSVSISEYGSRTGSFRVEYWSEGWKTAYSGYGIGPNAYLTFPPVTGTAARILFVSGSYTPIIYEFGVQFN